MVSATIGERMVLWARSLVALELGVLRRANKQTT
jgi:hypothetical protein